MRGFPFYLRTFLHPQPPDFFLAGLLLLEEENTFTVSEGWFFL
nr:hypothetical protein [Fredinandcohnia onubensis]